MTTEMKKPIPLRIVFILNLFKIFLAAGLYYYFSTNEVSLGSVGPQIILYTLFAYMTLFIGIIYTITKKNLTGLKIVVFIDLLVSLPASAFAGILISVISLLLLFFNSKIRTYFS
jgi:hypothetical protein